MMIPEILDKDWHPNGSAEPFVAAIIDDPNDGETKLVILFEEEGHIAVLSLDRIIEAEDISAKTHANHADRNEDQLRSLLWGK